AGATAHRVVEGPELRVALLTEVKRVVRVLIPVGQELDAVLEEERDADRRDQRRDPRSVTQRAIGEPLDRDTEDPRAAHTSREHERNGGVDADLHGGWPGKPGQHAEPEERPDHVTRAVR